MAIYSLNSGASRIAGSRRGSTFQRTANGFVIRHRVAPVQKRTPSQSVAKNRLDFVQKRWKTLASGDRFQWATERLNYPRVNSLGDVYFQSPLNFQSGANINQVIISDPPIDIPEIVPVFPDLIVSEIGININTQIIELISTPNMGPVDRTVPMGFSMKIFLAAPVSPGTTVVNIGGLRLVATLTPGTDTGTVNHWNAFNEIFGDPNGWIGYQLTGALQLVNNPGGVNGPLITGIGDIV